VSTDFILSAARDWRWITAAGVTALVLLAVLAALLRKLGRRDLSRTVTTLATVLGLAWSAQGMWDTAVHHYRQDVPVASVLFVVFESMMLARMLQARRYRTDLERRAKHVRAVWLIAAVMALVVALGEGWVQAPARLAIPLLVAYGWWTDLTADDDPGVKLKTSLRWTPRRLGLAIGMLEATASDAETIDRDILLARMVRLAFRIHHGHAWLNDILRRPVRLSRLKTLADDAAIREVRLRLARMSVDLMTPPEPEQQRRLIVPPPGRIQLPGRKEDRLAIMRASMTADRPNGLTAQELAAELGVSLRTAEGVAAEARRMNDRALS
jgi:hypothetical protein